MDNILEKMYNQNPWWENSVLIENDYHIKDLQNKKYVFLNKEFLEYKFQDGVYIVTGQRQIGKTTHLKLFIKKMITEKNKEDFFYFNCDILDTKKDVVDLIETYLKEFRARKKRKFIVLDEITSVKDSILAIKYLIDAGKKEKITYILTGSSSVNIKKTGEFLPGRRGKGENFIFSPISFSDFLSAEYPNIRFKLLENEPLEKFYLKLDKKVSLSKELNKYLISGGIPRIVNDYFDNKQISMDSFNLYRDWIISEIAKNGKKEHIAKVILQRILFSISSDISYNAFASDTGIGSHNTVYDYISFLEDAFVVKQIYNYDYRQKKINFKKNKKIYLKDVFLFWLLNGWLNGDFAAYKKLAHNPELFGKLAKNSVFIHLESLFKEISFYRSDKEIDFIFKNFAWECKYQNKIAPSDFEGLKKFKGKKFIITKDKLDIEEENKFIPLKLFLLLDRNYFEKN